MRTFIVTASRDAVLADVRGLPALPFLELLDDHGVAGARGRCCAPCC